MKRWIRAAEDSSNKFHFNIVYEIEYPRSDDFQSREVAAPSYKGFDVPDGPLLPADKDIFIDSQELADYHDFIESIESLLTDYYDLEVYYKNDSEYNSFYFGLLAKNSDGTLILDFDFTLRISTHAPKRTTQSQAAKKEQAKQLRDFTSGKKTKPLRATIIVNNEKFDTYLDAYTAVDKEISDKVEIMQRRKA